MISPLQTGAGTASTTLMQSILDQTEERRVEEEKKAKKFPDEDAVQKARVSASKSHSALNDKINAHFFGALKSDGAPMAELISRFLNVLGVEQDKEESNADFSTRVNDMLTLVAMIGKEEANLPSTSPIPGGAREITLARFRVTVDGIDAVLNETAENPSELTKMAARFVTRQGLTQDEGESDKDYSKRIGEAMGDVRKSMPADIATLEEKTGLRKLGLTADDLVAAIRNPSGEHAQAVQEALDDQARDAGISSDDAQIAIQRLEDLADPKTKEELKLERTHQPDPTKVENAETRKEREEDIRTLEAAEKLDDVRDVQETIADVNEAVLDGGSGVAADGEVPVDVIAAGDLLITLAAGAEIAETEAQVESTENRADGGRIEPIDTDSGKTEQSKEAQDEADIAVLVARSGPGDAAAPTEGDGSDAILAVNVDENGIYEILKREAESQRAEAA